jgi:hypothetical protein
VLLLLGAPGWIAVVAYIVASALVDGILAHGRWILEPYDKNSKN